MQNKTPAAALDRPPPPGGAWTTLLLFLDLALSRDVLRDRQGKASELRAALGSRRDVHENHRVRTIRMADEPIGRRESLAEPFRGRIASHDYAAPTFACTR